MPKTEQPPHPAPSSAPQRLLRAAAILIVFTVLAVLISRDASLEGEYRGDLTDSLSGRGVLVLRDGQILSRSIDGDETSYASYRRENGAWVVTTVTGTNGWTIDRGFWGFKLIIPNAKAERFRRLLPFENPYVEFPE